MVRKREAWQAAVQEIVKSHTQLDNWGEGHHAGNVLEIVVVFHFDLMVEESREAEREVLVRAQSHTHTHTHTHTY